MTADPSERIAAAIDQAQDLLADDDHLADDPGEAYPPDAEDVDWDLLRACAAEPQNDIGNSRRLRHRFGDRIIHVQNVAFFAYDGKRWAEDIDGRVTRPLAHETAQAIQFEPFVMQPTPEEKAAMEAAEDARARKPAIEGEMAGAEDAESRKTAAGRLAELQVTIDHGDRARKALSKRRSDRRRFGTASGNAGKLNGMLSEALAYLSHPVDDLDREPLALNVGNHTLRFEVDEVEDLECPDPDVTRYKRQVTVRCDSHNRADMISKLSDVDYDPEAACPEFDAFLATILPRPEVRAFVLRYLGYALTGLTREQVFAIFHGEGRNGKSTLVDIVARILGDYSTMLPIATLINDNRGGKGSEATPDLARLPGARFVRSSEPREGLSLDTSLIKQLTGGEPISVRRLNQEFIDVRPLFKLVIQVNRLPNVRGDDDGTWRRVMLVPFEVQIDKDKTDKDLPDKLWAERSGILNRLIGGLVDYFEHGLDPPDAVKAATEDYREDSDQLGAFIKGALTVTRDAGDKIEAGKMFDAYLNFCDRASVTPLRRTVFNRRMGEAAHRFGIVKAKSSIIVYEGCVVKPDFAGSPSRTHRDDLGG